MGRLLAFLALMGCIALMWIGLIQVIMWLKPLWVWVDKF